MYKDVALGSCQGVAVELLGRSRQQHCYGVARVLWESARALLGCLRKLL